MPPPAPAPPADVAPPATPPPPPPPSPTPARGRPRTASARPPNSGGARLLCCGGCPDADRGATPPPSSRPHSSKHHHHAHAARRRAGSAASQQQPNQQQRPRRRRVVGVGAARKQRQLEAAAAAAGLSTAPPLAADSVVTVATSADGGGGAGSDWHSARDALSEGGGSFAASPLPSLPGSPRGRRRGGGEDDDDDDDDDYEDEYEYGSSSEGTGLEGDSEVGGGDLTGGGAPAGGLGGLVAGCLPILAHHQHHGGITGTAHPHHHHQHGGHGGHGGHGHGSHHDGPASPRLLGPGGVPPKAGCSLRPVGEAAAAAATPAEPRWAWEPVDGTEFNVRSRDYLRTKRKEPSAPGIYTLVAADMFQTERKAFHVARALHLPPLSPGGGAGDAYRRAVLDPTLGLAAAAAAAGGGGSGGGTGSRGGSDGGAGGAGAAEAAVAANGGGAAATPGATPTAAVALPPLLIINLQMPHYPAALFGGASDGPGQSIVLYFALPEGYDPAQDCRSHPEAMGLLARFLAGGVEADGSATRERLKLIPRVVNVEEWARRAPLSAAEHRLLLNYNEKPVLTRPQHHFFTADGRGVTTVVGGLGAGVGLGAAASGGVAAGSAAAAAAGAGGAAAPAAAPAAAAAGAPATAAAAGGPPPPPPAANAANSLPPHLASAYLEVDLDVHSYAFLARKALNGYHSRLKEVVYDLALVVQGNGEAELPERVVAAARLYRVDFGAVQPLSHYAAAAAARLKEQGLQGGEGGEALGRAAAAGTGEVAAVGGSAGGGGPGRVEDATAPEEVLRRLSRLSAG